MRAFAQLRRMLASHDNLARRVDEMEKKYDGQLQVVFEAIKQLMLPAEEPKKKIGFEVKQRSAPSSPKLSKN
jgi:hypothetical protein